MKKLPLGVIISILGAVCMPLSGFAQGISTKKEEKSNWYDNLRMNYIMVYEGPRFNNFDLTKNQGPNDDSPSYTQIVNIYKLGYAISKRVSAGFEFTGFAPMDPSKQFSFGDIKNYVTWNRMVETEDLEITGSVKVAYPTTQSSIDKGKLMDLRVQGNWVLKTPLRNWNFSANTKLTSHFYKNPSSQTDFDVSLEPAISVDVLPNVSWLLEAAFDANHSFDATTFDFRQGDPDSFDTGPSFNIGSHVNLTTTMKFYTGHIGFDNATLYAELVVSL
jgi:hypothetical protein